jgi:hypothetical protein
MRNVFIYTKEMKLENTMMCIFGSCKRNQKPNGNICISDGGKVFLGEAK